MTPEFWRPFPEDESVWDRYPNVNIHYPLNGTPAIVGVCDRTYNTSRGPKTERLPDMDLSINMSEVATDPELAPLAAVIDPALREMLYILWQRKINPPQFEGSQE